jgi:general secretion pathway protein I
MNEVEEHLYKEGFQETDETGTGPCCEGDETPNMRCTWRADRPQFPEAKFGDLNLGANLDFGSSSSPGGGGLGALGAIGMLTGAGGPSPLGSASSISDIAKTLTDANAMAAATSALSASPPPPSFSSTSTSSSGGASTDMGGAGSAMGGLASLAMSFVYPNLKLLFEASTRRITVTLTFREGKKEYSIDVVEWFSVPQKGLAATDDGTSTSSSSSSSSSGTTTRTLPPPPH